MDASLEEQSLEVRVPGKMMLAGEYAVLKGGPSLSVTVDAYLSLAIRKDTKPGVWVESNIWTEPKQVPSSLATEPLLDSLHALSHCNARVSVRSDLAISFGLGSSSAVRLAAHLATRAFQKPSMPLTEDERWDAAREAWQRQRAEQGFASGYDLLTQLQGGLVAWQPDYEKWPGNIANHELGWVSEFVHPYVGGKGAPTRSVGGSVKDYLADHDLWPELLERSADLVDAFLRQTPESVIQANTAHQFLFKNAPFYPRDILNLLASLSHFGRSWTFKTTGAGGEDAILLLGARSELTEADQALRREGWRPLPHAFTRDGSRISWKDLGP